MHHGRMPDLPRMSEEHILDFLAFVNTALKARSDFMPPDLLLEAWNLELPKIKRLILLEAEKVNTSVESVFDMLLPYYLAVREKTKENDIK